MSLLSKLHSLNSLLGDIVELSIFKRAGGVTIVGNRSMSDSQVSDKLHKVVMRQGGPRAMAKLIAKMEGKSVGAVNDDLRARFKASGRVAYGTVAEGKKGKRVYVSRGAARKGDLRDIVHHEKFHNIPIIGKYEIGAHFYGGLRSKKGKMSFKKGLSRIGHLAKTRPSRLAIEVGGIAAGALGVKKALKKPDRDG